MRIIICGAGEYGCEIAKKFSERKHDVTVIDKSPERIKWVDKNLDVSTVLGEITDIHAFRKAGIEKTDLFIATSPLDEVNLISCYFAHTESDCKKIARIRNIDFAEHKKISYKAFGISNVISPERLAIQDLIDVLNSPGSFEVIKVFGGKVVIKGYIVQENAPVAGRTIRALNADYSYLKEALLIYINREGELIYPRPDVAIRSGDKVYICFKREIEQELTGLFNKKISKIKNIFIAGTNNATNILLKKLIQRKYKIKIFEEDDEKALALAQDFKNVRVVQGLITDTEIYQTEGIDHCDCFIAASQNEEINLITALFAKKHKVPINVVYSDKPDFFSFILSAGIDIIISPQISAIGNIMRIAREGVLNKRLPASFEGSELYKQRVQRRSKANGKCIKDLALPQHCLIVLVVREREPIVPKGTTMMEEDDILFFLTASKNINIINRLL